MTFSQVPEVSKARVRGMSDLDAATRRLGQGLVLETIAILIF